MDVRFNPTLKQMAFARVARGILYTFDLETLKLKFTNLGRVRDDYILQMETKVSNIVIQAFEETFKHLSVSPRKSEEVKYLILPTSMQKRLVGVVMALGQEIKNWFVRHSFILRDNNLKLNIRLAWHSIGIIDRFETAQNFIQDETLSNVERFYLACKYYFESDVHLLWTNMSESDRDYVRQYFGNTRSMQYWLSALENGNPLDWNLIPSREGDVAFFNENFFGMRYYFTKINAENRFQCILRGLRSRKAYHFDMYSCLHQINRDELNAILCRLPKGYLHILSKYLLDWPFQIMFFDVINIFAEDIDESIFYDLIKCILFDKLEKGWKDHQYIELLSRFWYQMSDRCGNAVKRDRNLYAVLNFVLKNSDPFDIRFYRHFIDNYTSFRIV